MSVGDPRGCEVVVQSQGLVEKAPGMLVLPDHVIITAHCKPRYCRRWVSVHELVRHIKDDVLHIDHNQRRDVHGEGGQVVGVVLEDPLGDVVARLVVALVEVSRGLRCEGVAVLCQSRRQVLSRVLLRHKALALQRLLQPPLPSTTPPGSGQRWAHGGCRCGSPGTCRRRLCRWHGRPRSALRGSLERVRRAAPGSRELSRVEMAQPLVLLMQLQAREKRDLLVQRQQVVPDHAVQRLMAIGVEVNGPLVPDERVLLVFRDLVDLAAEQGKDRSRLRIHPRPIH
mmetsp:Transcript_52712/g.112759  ORF Transcript_52712/g.112759 Transcript_52712/m.112759 type:complete len:284 (+) Transcript_52712:609-1460(+)